MNIIGHQPILSYFDKVIANKGLSHCYLFSGPAHVGKTAALGEIVQKLIGPSAAVDLEHPETLASRYPDFYFLRVEEDKSEISVDAVREFRSRLSMGSFGKGLKIAVIYQADALNSSSANALLKLLEEPTADTVLFLLTDRPRAILPTIKSRAVNIEFSLVSRSEMMAGLSEEASAPDLARAINASCGKPGQAIRFLKNPPEFDTMMGQAAGMIKLLSMPDYELINYFSEQEYTDSFFDLLLLVLRDAMLVLAGQEDQAALQELMKEYRGLKGSVSVSRIAGIISRIEELRGSPLYLNQELQLEQTFISL